MQFRQQGYHWKARDADIVLVDSNAFNLVAVERPSTIIRASDDVARNPGLYKGKYLARLDRHSELTIEQTEYLVAQGRIRLAANQNTELENGVQGIDYIIERLPESVRRVLRYERQIYSHALQARSEDTADMRYGALYDAVSGLAKSLEAQDTWPRGSRKKKPFPSNVDLHFTTAALYLALTTKAKRIVVVTNDKPVSHVLHNRHLLTNYDPKSLANIELARHIGFTEQFVLPQDLN
jgi:hypothetical protein